jgi:hypothetical protein
MFAFLDILTGIQATTYIKIGSIQISLKEHCIIQVLFYEMHYLQTWKNGNKTQ